MSIPHGFTTKSAACHDGPGWWPFAALTRRARRSDVQRVGFDHLRRLDRTGISPDAGSGTASMLPGLHPHRPAVTDFVVPTAAITGGNLRH